MFITLDKVWKDGQVDQEQFSKIFLRRPEHCFETVVIQKTGRKETVWATFGKADWSEQIDLDVNSLVTRNFFKKVLVFMQEQRVSVLRLDAIAFVTKKAGTDCFFVEPEIYQFLDWIREAADQHHIQLLPEVHAHYAVQNQLAAQGFYVYNFVLPFLILHTLLSGSSLTLQMHLKDCPRKQITMLDCHDGIPVLPDIKDVVSIPQAQAVVNHCLQQGANISRIFSAHSTLEGGFDAHQINCTYYSALENNDDAYLSARAIQFFAPGIPQVYYVGLLAGENDDAAVTETGEKRAINRHNYGVDEIMRQVQKPVVQRLLSLIDFRNNHPAFQGVFCVEESEADTVQLVWQKGEHYTRLRVNLTTRHSEIEYSGEDRSLQRFEP
jgi:sucrose phosphorylase